MCMGPKLQMTCREQATIAYKDMDSPNLIVGTSDCILLCHESCLLQLGFTTLSWAPPPFGPSAFQDANASLFRSLLWAVGSLNDALPGTSQGWR